MNKADLVEAIASKTNLTKTKSKKVLEIVLSTTKEALTNDERVAIVGFGSFSTTHRKARVGRNPKTGQTVHIPEKTVVKFKQSEDLLK